MKNILFCCVALPLLIGVCRGAPQSPAQPAPTVQVQKYVVVHSIRFLADTESLTNAQANCTILAASGAASVQCHPTGVTQKEDYHFVAVLIVDTQGTGFVIACRNSLIAFWCKEFSARTVILGNMAKSNLAVSDGDKVHNYAVLTSAYIGLAAAGLQAPAPAAAALTPAATAPPAAAPAPASAPAAAAVMPPRAAAEPLVAASRTTDIYEAPSGDASAPCASTTGACVSFISEPPGADIYVDDKFVGNAPSMITLSAGSHEIRMENGDRKPWTRELQTSAGSKIRVRGTFEAPEADK